MDTEKRIAELSERLGYIRDIFGSRENANITLLTSKLHEFGEREPLASPQEAARLVQQLEEIGRAHV